MIPAKVDYARPDSIAAAIELLSQPGVRALAGGQSLIPLLRSRTVTPRLLVDLHRLPSLGRIRRDDGEVILGALATHRQVATAPELAGLPMFADVGACLGDVQVRNRGTFGGSLAYADPAGDWAPVALAADATIEVAGPAGARSLGIEEFFRAAYTPNLEPGELITGVRIPLGRVARSAYVKLADGASGATLAGVAAMITVEHGEIRAARVAATGATATPRRLTAVESALLGRPPERGAIAAAATLAPDAVEVPTGEDYRRQLLSVACARAVTAAGRRPAG